MTWIGKNILGKYNSLNKGELCWATFLYKKSQKSSLFSQPQSATRMPRLSDADRSIALSMVEAGMSMGGVAQRFAATGKANNRPRRGQPRVTSQDRYIALSNLWNRFQTVPTTTVGMQGRCGHVSAITVRRRLREAGIFNHDPMLGYF